MPYSGDFTDPPPPRLVSISATNNALYKKGFLDATLYDGWDGNPVDPTGAQDSTKGLQKFLTDIVDYKLAGYIPSGTYLISKTLHACKKTGAYLRHRHAPVIVGPNNGPRPVIKLKNNASGFQNKGISVSKPLMAIWIINDDGRRANNFGVDSGGLGQAFTMDNGNDLAQHNVGYFMAIARINFDCGSSNPGAVGLCFRGAQDSHMEDIAVSAHGAWAGFVGTPSRYSAGATNIEVDGGDYGFVEADDAGYALVNVRFHDQEVACYHGNSFVPVSIIGFDFRISGNAALTQTKSGSDGSMTLIDGKVQCTGATAFRNTQRQGLYLKNVYVTGTDSLVEASGNNASGTGTWKRIREYVYTGDDAHGQDTKSIVEGVIGRERSQDIQSNASPPPANLASKHSWTKLPEWDDPETLYAGDLGVSIGSSSPQTSAIQSAIDAASNDPVANGKLFLGRGEFFINGTIELRANTKLIGISNAHTHIMSHSSWLPNSEVPMVRTADSATADTYIGHMFIMSNNEIPYDRLGLLHWRAGRQSMVVAIGGNHYPGGDDDTNPHSFYKITGNGGGRWYFIGPHARHNAIHPDYRGVYAENTHEPWIWYGINLEKNNGRWQSEFQNCSNVRIFGPKVEGSAPVMLIEDCSNFEVHCAGAMRRPRNITNGACFEVRGTADGVVLTNINSQDSKIEAADDDTVRDISGVGVPWPDRVNYFRRGTTDDSVLFDDVTEETNLPPVVSAGPDGQVTLPASYNLQGSATDDGLPDGTLNINWSHIAGTISTRLFPQHIPYSGIRPLTRTQSQMDDDVRDYYDAWKSVCLVNMGNDGQGRQMYRVAAMMGTMETTSQMMGYGMVISAIMAGHDSNAQTIFDGLYIWSRTWPSEVDSRLMARHWPMPKVGDVGFDYCRFGKGSSTDGDLDIAYGLLLAKEQWGTSSDVDYDTEITNVLDGIYESCIGRAWAGSTGSIVEILGNDQTNQWATPMLAAHQNTEAVLVIANTSPIEWWASFSNMQNAAKSSGSTSNQNRFAASHVALVVTGDARTVSSWESSVASAIGNIRAQYPNLQQIALIPGIGGFEGDLCNASSGGTNGYVSASWNYADISTAIQNIAATLSDVFVITDATVLSCSDYSDGEGSLTSSGGQAVGEKLYLQIFTNTGGNSLEENSNLPVLGDWVSTGSFGKYNQWTTRPADYMLSHFRAFDRHEGLGRWAPIITACQADLQSVQDNSTGLLPDFREPISVTNGSPRPADELFFESTTDDDYSRNAGRIPLRAGLDYLLNGNFGAKLVVDQLASWIDTGQGTSNWWDNLLIDENTHAVPVVSRPGYLSPITDPVFGTTITRITGDNGSAISGVSGGVWGLMSRHFYSKVNAWNADDSMIWLRYNEEGLGSGYQIFLDGNTYQPLFTRSATMGDDDKARWHPTNPKVMFIVEGNSLESFDVLANNRGVIKTFPLYSDIAIGPLEGNFSADGNRVVFSGTRTSDGGIDVFLYDIGIDHTFQVIDLGVSPTYDWASISPLGNWIVIEYTWTDTKVYHIDGTFSHSFQANVTHQDMGIDHLGREVSIGEAAGQAYDGQNIVHYLDNGTLAPLHSGGGVSHTSMRNTNLPGWAYSSINEGTAVPPYNDEIIAVATDASEVRRFCHTHHASADYFAEVHPCPSHDGSRVLFASSWDSGSGRPSNLYVCDARSVSSPTSFEHIVRPSYHMDGTYESGWDTYVVVLVSRLGVAALVNPSRQQLLNDIYDKVRTTHQNCYADSVTMMSMLVMSGNYWDPTAAIPGTGSVVFSDSSSPTSQVSFGLPGTYNLKLEASDGQYTVSDNVSIVATEDGGGPTNQAPVVDAGADQQIVFPASAELTATVTDDGLPGGVEFYFWQQNSGPGPVDFSHPNAKSTTVTFSQIGVYVLGFIASDGELFSEDTVTVEVTVAPPGAVTFDVKSDNGGAGTAFTHSLGAGINRVLNVVVTYEGEKEFNLASGLTANGVTMIPNTTVIVEHEGSQNNIIFYHLLDVDLPVSGDVVINADITDPDDPPEDIDVHMAAISLFGVEQAYPSNKLGQFEVNEVEGTHTIELTLTDVEPNSMIIDTVTDGYRLKTLTPTAGQTEWFNLGVSLSQTAAGGYQLSALGGDVPVSWQTNAGRRLVLGAIAFPPAKVLPVIVGRFDINIESNGAVIDQPAEDVFSIGVESLGYILGPRSVGIEAQGYVAAAFTLNLDGKGAKGLLSRHSITGTKVKQVTFVGKASKRIQF